MQREIESTCCRFTSTDCILARLLHTCLSTPLVAAVASRRVGLTSSALSLLGACAHPSTGRPTCFSGCGFVPAQICSSIKRERPLLPPHVPLCPYTPPHAGGCENCVSMYCADVYFDHRVLHLLPLFPSRLVSFPRQTASKRCCCCLCLLTARLVSV